VRFAYADPPYPGQSKRLYGDHPDYAGEVDHAELVARLCRDYPDGWALSTSVEAFREVLILCPPDVRVAIWNVTNRRPFSGAGRWHQSWEPVIVHGGRQKWGEAPRVRDLMSSGALAATGDVFSRWLFDLLGATQDDQLDDLFSGSGTVGREWEKFRSQQSFDLTLSFTKNRTSKGWVPREWPTLDAAGSAAS